MTTVVLWPTTSGSFATVDLLGKPVWQRTLEACQRLRPRRALWCGKPPADGLEPTTARKLGSLRGTVVLVAAELACASPSALRRLARAGRRAPAALFQAEGGAPVAIACDASQLTGSRARGLAELSRALRPTPVFDEPESLLVVGDARAWSDAHRVLRERKISELMNRGVLIPDPSSVQVDPEVQVTKGAILHPWVRIEGASRIGAGAVVQSFSHIVDSTVGANTTILDHCFLRDSRVGKAASIGPFTHLRPSADVGDEARVGNFVELKKSRLGRGAKVSHLAYVGDATVGRDANLGAGTITCNYDGKAKNRTVVGDGAFIGSDVQLVAPVRVGKGAYVAAGSCVVEDVPAHSLALARSRQIIKKGWAKQKNKKNRG